MGPDCVDFVKIPVAFLRKCDRILSCSLFQREAGGKALKKRLLGLGIPALSMVLLSLYPCAFLFFRNAGEARAGDMLPFFVIFLLTALILFLPALLLLQNASRAAVLADLGVLAAANFSLLLGGIRSLLPGYTGNLQFLLMVLVFLAEAVLLLRKRPDMTAVCGLIALAAGGMLLVSAVPAVPTLISAATYSREDVETDESLRELRFQGERRNFYYMIFDEYGGPENLQHYFGDSNEAFYSALEDRGFTVSRDTRNTESPWTVTLVPNMLNLQYVTSDDVAIQNRLEWLEDPALYQLFRANDYRIQLVNQDGFLGEAGCRVLTRDQTEETISDYLYENSVFCRVPVLSRFLEERVLRRDQDAELRGLTDAVDAMKNCWRSADQEGTLTVCYLIAPHAPFLLEEDGTPTDPADHYNWHRPELYLAKLRYISQAILETVDAIQAHDPEAVILLQADHGCRLPGLLVERYGGPWFDTEAEIPYMENAMCCLYLPRDCPDIRGDTCINALRKALNGAYGLELAPVTPPPDYTIPDEYMPPPPEEAEE